MAGEDVVNAGTQYAQYIPPSVIRGMLGFPEEDIEQFLEFVHIILEGIDHPEEERIIEFEPVEKYFVAQIEEHMDSPRDDLTSYLLNAELDGQNLALEHVFGTMVLILVAGIDTTWSAIGSAIWHSPTTPRTWRGWSMARSHARRNRRVPPLLRSGHHGTTGEHDMEYQGCPMKRTTGFCWVSRRPSRPGRVQGRRQVHHRSSGESSRSPLDWATPLRRIELGPSRDARRAREFISAIPASNWPIRKR